MNKNYLMKVNDIYGISRRIREVNSSYCLFLNLLTKKYEVHDLSNHFNSLCLTLEPHELNSTLIRKLHISKRENMKNYFIQIEENNKKIEAQQKQKLLNQTSDLTKEIFDYASHKNRDLSDVEIKNIVSKAKGE